MARRSPTIFGSTRRPRKPELSPTRIKTFLICRMMYRLEYVERVGRFYHRANPGYAFGSTLHQTLQRFHEAGGAEALSADELIAHLDLSWQSQGYQDVAHETAERAEAVRILQAYHAAARDEAETRTFLTEKVLKLDMGAFVLTGRIDRIDEHESDGSLEIIDYKSGRSQVTSQDVQDSLAMAIYQLLVKRNWPERRVFATIVALRTGEAASAVYSDDELAEFEEEIGGVGLEIIETDFESVVPVPLRDACPDCDFLRLCSRTWQREKRPWKQELEM